jgi:alkylhydroperoxidase/carboxymuconolactone decarboxylase family protein YurZ
VENPLAACALEWDGGFVTDIDHLGGATMAEASDTPVLDLIGKMTANSIEASSLDDDKLMLVRIAALVAVDAPPVSYMLNLGAAAEIDLDPEEIQGVLTAIAPIVGTPRITAAAGNMVRALGLALDLAELEDD